MYNNKLMMQKQKGLKKTQISQRQDMDEKRITTAPIRDRPKHLEASKIPHQQMAVRGKNVTRQSKRPKKEENREHEAEQIHKRPQTSKGSRGNKLFDSEYYEEDGDDLIGTTKVQKIDMLKKPSKDT